MKIRFTPRARSQAQRADNWWREHSEVKDRFAQELSQALQRIRMHPGIRQSHVVGTREVRRVLMPLTSHHVYYSVKTSTEVVIHAVWGASRGSLPNIDG